MPPRPDILDFYRRQSRMSDPGRHSDALAALPHDVAGVVNTVQGLILHEHWSAAYSQTLSDERQRVPPVVFNAVRQAPETV